MWVHGTEHIKNRNCESRNQYELTEASILTKFWSRVPNMSKTFGPVGNYQQSVIDENTL